MTRMHVRSATISAVLAAAFAFGPVAVASATQVPGCNPAQQSSRTGLPGRAGFQGDEVDFNRAQAQNRQPGRAGFQGEEVDVNRAQAQNRQPGRPGFVGDEPDFNRASGQTCDSQAAPARPQNALPGVRLPRVPGG